MSGPTVSVVVRCYNEAEYIGKLLHGLSEQSVDDVETILVDSGSTDGTLEIAEEFGVNQIRYIDPEDFSFGRALNYGCEVATGEYIVVASAHVYPRRDDWIEQLLTKFTDDVALVYGKQRGNETTTFSENQIFEQWFPDEDVERQDHPFCNNANAAIRREVWEEYPYDELLTGLEDLDWAKRVQKAGWDVSYAAEAEIVHVHDETSSEVFNRYRREAFAHKQVIPNQSFSLLDFLKLSVTSIVSDSLSAYRKDKLKSKIYEIVQFRLLQYWGTYRGFAREGPISDQLWQRFYYPDRSNYPPSNRTDDGDTETNGEYTGSANWIDYSNYRSELDQLETETSLDPS